MAFNLRNEPMSIYLAMTTWLQHFYKQVAMRTLLDNSSDDWSVVTGTQGLLVNLLSVPAARFIFLGPRTLIRYSASCYFQWPNICQAIREPGLTDWQGVGWNGDIWTLSGAPEHFITLITFHVLTWSGWSGQTRGLHYLSLQHNEADGDGEAHGSDGMLTCHNSLSLSHLIR